MRKVARHTQTHTYTHNGKVDRRRRFKSKQGIHSPMCLCHTYFSVRGLVPVFVFVGIFMNFLAPTGTVNHPFGHPDGPGPSTFQQF